MQRKLLALVLALVCLAGAAAAGEFISIATSSAGGTFSIVGTAMADIINRNVPEISANIEITGGSAENILLASSGNVEIALTASDVMYLALNGKGSFEGKNVGGLAGMMGGIMNTMQVYTLKEGPIKKMSDLRGKKVSVGPPGSVGNDGMRLILEAYGMEINKDWTPEYLSHSDGAEALTDGNVDAVCIMTIAPAGAPSTAAASKELRVLDIEDDIMNKILEKSPFYVRSSLPAGTYRGQDEAVKNCIGSATLLICQEKLSEDVIYKITKALYNNTEELVKAYPQCREFVPENARRGMTGLQMHPGAVKYLKEIGMDK